MSPSPVPVPQAPTATKTATGANGVNGVNGTATSSPDTTTPNHNLNHTHRHDLILPAYPIDEPAGPARPPLSVGIVGAGMAGVLAAILLPAKVPGVEVQVYEKNGDVGGTWLENSYPGVRCDVPAHVYQPSFAPNTQWTEEFAQGPEILAYWKRLAREYGVYERLRPHTRVVRTDWREDAGQWALDLEDARSNPASSSSSSSSSSRTTVTHDVLILAIGHFNAWRLPAYSGRDAFAAAPGHALFHTSAWDHGFDPAGKRVALIGNGASGLQVLPYLQVHAAHVDHYARSRTWVADALSSTAVRRLEPNVIPEEARARWADDPDEYLRFRKGMEEPFWRRFRGALRGSPENRALRENWTNKMRARVIGAAVDATEREAAAAATTNGIQKDDARDEEKEKKKGEQKDAAIANAATKATALADSLIPDFPPNCRRPTPGPGYLEALAQPNVDLIQTPISHFTSSAIVTADGTTRPADAVVCATGANVDFIPPFPVVARGDNLQSAWAPTGTFGYPHTYLGLGTPGFPNLLLLGGPSSTGFGGSVPHSLENQVAYVGKLLRKVRGQRLRTFTPRADAADEFADYARAFFSRTVFTPPPAATHSAAEIPPGERGCSSWYNGANPTGPVVGLFPGSAAMLNMARREPRWEDWEWGLPPEARGNRFVLGWGCGESAKETDPAADVTAYLNAWGNGSGSWSWSGSVNGNKKGTREVATTTAARGKEDLRALHEAWWEA